MKKTNYLVIELQDGAATRMGQTDDPAALVGDVVPAEGPDELENTLPTAQEGEEAPACQVHHVPMALQKGKYGTFWSCHERTADGRFCSYKPSDR